MFFSSISHFTRNILVDILTFSPNISHNSDYKTVLPPLIVSHDFIPNLYFLYLHDVKQLALQHAWVGLFYIVFFCFPCLFFLNFFTPSIFHLLYFYWSLLRLKLIWKILNIHLCTLSVLTYFFFGVIFYFYYKSFLLFCFSSTPW